MTYKARVSRTGFFFLYTHECSVLLSGKVTLDALARTREALQVTKPEQSLRGILFNSLTIWP
jgi:hypothetical protein